MNDKNKITQTPGIKDFSLLILIISIVIILSIPLSKNNFDQSIGSPVTTEIDEIQNDVYTAVVVEKKNADEFTSKNPAQQEILNVKINSWDPASNDITNITCMTEEETEELLAYILKKRRLDTSNPIYLNADDLVLVEQKYNISATSMIAIMVWETGFKSDNFKYKNNVAGIKKSDGSYKSFSSKEESILYTGELLNKYVYSYNLSTWEEIGNRYCDELWTEHIIELTELYNSYLYELRNE